MSARTKRNACLFGGDCKTDRRTSHRAILRRLINAGNLLATEAREQYGIGTEITDDWEYQLEALRGTIACACPRCTLNTQTIEK